MRRRAEVAAVGAGALILMVGIPAATLWALGHLHASFAGYALGIVIGAALMVGWLRVLQRATPDPFVLEVAIVLAFGAGVVFAAWLAVRSR